MRSAAGILLVLVMLLVRIVDLHWHQSLDVPPGSFADLQVQTNEVYLADAATPHQLEMQESDIQLLGDDGWPQSLPIVAIVVVLLFLLPLLPRPRLRPPQHWLRRKRDALYALHPPLRGPPVLI